MDAKLLLQSQGWRGHGHTLHASDDSTGLAKPILVSRKDNRLGIGKKEHHAVSDQWWLNAFDQQLKGLDTTSSKKEGGGGAVVVMQTETYTRLNAFASGVGGGAGKYRGAAGLYASFVRGGMLEGTITPDESTATSSGAEDDGSGSGTPESEDMEESGDKSAAIVAKAGETKEERRARREARRLRRAERAARRAAKAQARPGTETVVGRDTETKEERRARKEAKRKRREERRLREGANG